MQTGWVNHYHDTAPCCSSKEANSVGSPYLLYLRSGMRLPLSMGVAEIASNHQDLDA